MNERQENNNKDGKREEVPESGSLHQDDWTVVVNLLSQPKAVCINRTEHQPKQHGLDWLWTGKRDCFLGTTGHMQVFSYKTGRVEVGFSEYGRPLGRVVQLGHSASPPLALD